MKYFKLLSYLITAIGLSAIVFSLCWILFHLHWSLCVLILGFFLVSIGAVISSICDDEEEEDEEDET